MKNLKHRARKEFISLETYVSPQDHELSGGALKCFESGDRLFLKSEGLGFREKLIDYSDIVTLYLPFEKDSRIVVLETMDGSSLSVALEDPYAFHRFLRGLRDDLMREENVPPLRVDRWGKPENYDSLSSEDRVALNFGDSN